MVDKELIEIWRDSLKPSVSLWLLNTNYEEMGEQDKEEFERDFDEILDLALIGLKHKAQLSQEDATIVAKSKRTFVELLVHYPHSDVCTYPEYKGKPYYSIKYIEDGECFVGFGTYKLEVLSRYLRDYFMPSAQPEERTDKRTETHACDLIDREAAVDAIYHHLPSVSRTRARTMLHEVPSAQPERTCVNCGRTVNNGGWYADGRTRCPIEEHYALPKDGYCHLWEKRNVTDDDYPERREE